jgi:hypothetical protein
MMFHAVFCKIKRDRIVGCDVFPVNRYNMPSGSLTLNEKLSSVILPSLIVKGSPSAWAVPVIYKDHPAAMRNSDQGKYIGDELGRMVKLLPGMTASHLI